MKLNFEATKNEKERIKENAMVLTKNHLSIFRPIDVPPRADHPLLVTPLHPTLLFFC